MLLAGSDKKCQIFNMRLDIHYNAISHSLWYGPLIEGISPKIPASHSLQPFSHKYGTVVNKVASSGAHYKFKSLHVAFSYLFVNVK